MNIGSPQRSKESSIMECNYSISTHIIWLKTCKRLSWLYRAERRTWTYALFFHCFQLQKPGNFSSIFAYEMEDAKLIKFPHLCQTACCIQSEDLFILLHNKKKLDRSVFNIFLNYCLTKIFFFKFLKKWLKSMGCSRFSFFTWFQILIFKNLLFLCSNLFLWLDLKIFNRQKKKKS